ncbi:MAG TPA: helix-turn-helix domain-containing protein [Chloroflexota bacterium]|nr:helix-turn-helix domain-containing protein [Chloroflexota bacterium]
MPSSSSGAAPRAVSAAPVASDPGPVPADDAAGADTTTWLPIRRAADLLGVSPATLRLWTAAGKVRAGVTPGGHRRYAEVEVRRLLAERREADWDAVAAELAAALRARYADLARAEAPRQAWFHRFDAPARARVHALGESLLAQVARLLAAPGARERARLLRDGRRIGAEYGREVARLGLAASDALAAFLFFRTPILESVNATVRARPGLALPAGDALAAVTDLLDAVLLALTRSYEASRAEPPRRAATGAKGPAGAVDAGDGAALDRRGPR